MTNREHLTRYGGYDVSPWTPGDPLPDPATTIVRISTDWDDERSWEALFGEFMALPGVEATRGLVVGWWGVDDSSLEPDEVVSALVAARDRLPALHVLFMGDVIIEENEVSWIHQVDLSPLLAAYPQLTHFGVRGGNGLSLGSLDLPQLRDLSVQTGGMTSELLREVMTARLPRLECLDLFLGTENYGATLSLDDLTPLLPGTLFPALTSLGLKNSDQQDAVAQLIAGAPLLERLHTLDLSLGTLTDEGAQALLGSERVRSLKRLDLHHHFLSEGMQARLTSALPGVDVDLSEPEDPEDEWRFVAMGE